MQIIPVIDLKDGLVVHALRGDRANYQAIHQHSVLTDSSRFEDVLNEFLNLHPFKRFYIADLNAITGTGDHYSAIVQATKDYPEIEFWLDNGSQLGSIKHEHSNLKWVIGTESQKTLPTKSNQDFILSLDFKDRRPAGLSDWFDQVQFWPETIIVMTLSRVGSNSGPDLEKLSGLRHAYPDKQFVAAGGIRNKSDLAELKAAGIRKALLATSLHTGAISSQDIQNL